MLLLDHIWASTWETNLRGLRTTKAQTSQRICTVWSSLYYMIFGKYHIKTWYKQNFNFLASLCSWTGWFEYDLVGNTEDRLSRNAAHLIQECGVITETKYSKPVLSGHSKKTKNLVFKTDYCLMQVKSIAECSKGSILQYFRPSLRYHLPLRPLFCLF